MGKHFLSFASTMRKRSMPIATVGTLCVLLTACSGSGPSPSSKKGKFDPKYGVSASVRVANKQNEFRKGGGHYKVGKPYKVAGKTYVPKDEKGYIKTGKASWYGDDFHGRLTANGEIFDMNTLTAAHPTLPLPSYARVTNLKNGRSVIVRINDRGPYAHGRVIDLSKRVAEVLSFKNDGITDVRVKYLGKARMDGKDAPYLEASYRKKGQRIGDDFKAVPKEGEHRAPPPEIMMASAAPKPQKKKDSNFLMAHVPALGSGFASNETPNPTQVASAPISGWAPVDLVGDGYFPPSGDLATSMNLAKMAPIQLFYTPAMSLRIETGHQAIANQFDDRKTSNLAMALKSKVQKATVKSGAAVANSADQALQSNIGAFEPNYALRLAEEFASIAAVEVKRAPNGLSIVRIVKLKSGVQPSDLTAMKKRLGLANG